MKIPCALSFALLFALAPNANADTLIEDVAQSCAALKVTATDHDEKLRNQFFGQLLACPVPNYWKAKAMSDAAKKAKKILRRSPKILPQDMPALEGRYRLSELEKLVLAQRFADTKVSAKQLERKLGQAVVFVTLHRAIDQSKLAAEIQKAPFLVGKAKQLLLDFYDVQKGVAAEWDQVRSSLPGENARFFTLAAERYTQWMADYQSNLAYGTLLAGLSKRLFNGERPSVPECEKPVLAAYGKHLSLGMGHPLSTLAVNVMAGCAHVRGDAGFAASFDGFVLPGREAIGPLGAMEDVVNAQLLGLAERQGRATRIKPATAIKYDFMRDTPFRPMRSATSGALQPTRGPMQVATATPVSYQGLPYVLVVGKGMKVRVPVMACTPTQMGWNIDNGKMTPRMGSACTFTGKHRNENLTTYPQLVPAVFATGIAAGKWYRFRSMSRDSSIRVDPEKLSAKGKKGVLFGVPVLRSASLKGFTADKNMMGLTRGELGPLLD